MFGLSVLECCLLSCLAGSRANGIKKKKEEVLNKRNVLCRDGMV